MEQWHINTCVKGIMPSMTKLAPRVWLFSKLLYYLFTDFFCSVPDAPTFPFRAGYLKIVSINVYGVDSHVCHVLFQLLFYFYWFFFSEYFLCRKQRFILVYYVLILKRHQLNQMIKYLSGIRQDKSRLVV